MINFWQMYNNNMNYNFNNYNLMRMPFPQFDWYNMGYIPFNFTVPSYPVFPRFNFSATSGGTSSASSVSGNELTPKQKAQIEEIRKMKYDSDNLRAKLDENKDINTYAKYLESNNLYHVADTINAADGGKIYLYEDSIGNRMGSINKDADGKIINVALNISDGGEISLNDSNGNDGIIDNRVVMSRNYDVSEDNKSYNDALAEILKNNSGYKVKTEQRENGRIVEYYYDKDGKNPIAFVQKDNSGNIISIDQMNIQSSDGREQKYFYVDQNGDGIINSGEGKTRFDIDLS